MTESHPNRLGRYDVQAELGRGSMGVVFLARDPLIGRLVALKVFHPAVAADPDERTRFRSRFLREAQSAGILSHPNIVTIHDVVDEGAEGRSFIAMEYVQGTNLKDVMRHGSGLELSQIVDVARQVAAALDYAHERGVVHRDVKPANVLLTPERQVKITDFGIARFESSNMTLDGQLLGTPNYMSPEQVQGREVGHRSDLFSFGVVVYEMITRHKPFAADSLAAVTHRIVYDDFTPAAEHVGELPPGLEQLFRRALAKDPARRYTRAGELAADLEQAVRSYTRDVALSETQSLPRSAVAAAPFPPDDDADTLPGTTDGPRTLRPRAGRERLAALRRRWAAGWSSGWAGRRTVAARRRLAPVLAGAGGLLAGIAPEDRPPPRRLALVAALTVALALAVGVPALLLSGPEEPERVEYPAEYRRNLEYLDLLREGLRLQAAGDPLSAAVSFRQAEMLVPSRPEAARLREQADQAARELQETSLRRSQVALQLAAAQSALAGQRYEEAAATAEVVLEVEPDNEEAAEVVEAARRALARRAAAARRAEREETLADGAGPEEPSAAAEPASGAGEEVGPISPARLEIVVVVAGEGRVMVREGQRDLANFTYENLERSGLLRRRRPVRETVRVPGVLSMAPGTHRLSYWVMPANEKAVHGVVTGTLRAGTSHVLRIVEHASGEVTARLE